MFRPKSPIFQDEKYFLYKSKSIHGFMAKEDSVTCEGSYRPQQIFTACPVVPELYFTLLHVSILQIFCLLLTNGIIKKTESIYHQICSAEAFKRIGLINIDRYPFPVVVIIHTVVISPSISFAGGDKLLEFNCQKSAF